MDYNDFELIAFWVLSLAPGVLLMTTGIIAHKRKSIAWVHLCLLDSILGCFIYGMFAGGLIGTLFPPPYVPGLSDGNGLDLRGIGFIAGAWLGALAGVAFALMTVAGSWIVRRLRSGGHDGASETA